MEIIIKEPKHAPYTATIDGTLKSMQSVVGGYIETVPFLPSVQMVCNEEGKLLDLPLNFNLWGDPIVGTVFFCGLNATQDDLDSILPEEVDRILRIFS